MAKAVKYRGKLAVSPMVSTGKANQAFNGKYGIATTSPDMSYVPGRIAPALEETTYFKRLTQAEQRHVKDKLLVDLGYSDNGLSTVFPYMAPDNNNQFFGGEIAREYVVNRNGHVRAVKTSQPWRPQKAREGEM